MPPEALTGFVNGHKHLGYLLALLPAIQVILVLAGGTKKTRSREGRPADGKNGLPCDWGACHAYGVRVVVFPRLRSRDGIYLACHLALGADGGRIKTACGPTMRCCACWW